MQTRRTGLPDEAGPLRFIYQDQELTQQAPLPTEEQLERVRDAIGASSLGFSHRIEGGNGCTMDVLSEPGNRLVLRRYGPWYAERGEDAAARETRALELLQRANIPAPAPIWIDTDDVFEEQAIVISYVDGDPELTPQNPFDWAERLAATLSRIHEVRLEEDDATVFPPGAGEDMRRIQDHPELVLEHPLGEDLLRRRVMLADRDVESEEVFSHTDFWPGNTLWSDGRIAAVVDWETPATGDREMDVAYCSLDIRYLGMDKVADHFVKSYKQESGDALPNLSHWEAVGLCRPMPDIARWVPAWKAMGRNIDEDKARARFTEVLEDFLERTG
jgi:aminoglycoside phosphotransferase (APT) family kinase protein